MEHQHKVEGITSENYKGVVDRASVLRAKLVEHYHAHGGFPSLGYIIEKWGFHMSLKALCRHRKTVMAELNIETLGKPTHVMPRPRKAPVAAEPATIEQETVEQETVEQNTETAL